jgi:sterol desaturase/sphingolipid hydroxylase (fatty acid hydroxylase superfamily)
MNMTSNASTIGLILASMAILSIVELIIPLRAREAWHRRHLLPNLVLTFISFALGLLLNTALVLGLVWLPSAGVGLFNTVTVHPLIELVGTVLVLDLAWYVTHVAMHTFSSLWRFHAIHHSDPVVDVTTTIRQHPGEGLIRYAFLAAFAFAAGTSPASFAVYRVWSALHGLTEHSNVRLPQWFDTILTFVFSSPNMHKVHHSREQRFTDSNYTNIFSIWDRMFGTFTPSRHGAAIAYGLDGHDGLEQQSTSGLLALPFRKPVQGTTANQLQR